MGLGELGGRAHTHTHTYVPLSHPPIHTHTVHVLHLELEVCVEEEVLGLDVPVEHVPLVAVLFVLCWLVICIGIWGGVSEGEWALGLGVGEGECMRG